MMFAAKDVDRIREMVASLTKVHIKGEVKAAEGTGLHVSLDEGRALIEADSKNALARGFFLLSRAVKEGKTRFSIKQSRHFDSCGVMLDLSRGSVMKPEAVKRSLDCAAALGMNFFSLYTEDTYTVPEYPYFGYLRGRYTASEMSEMDQYAASLDIEFVPSIQTLAHLGQFLQWQESEEMKDQPTVLMADDEKVYELIEAEIRAIRKMVKGRRLHIGMDEAHGVGLGRYFEKHGITDRFELLNRHLSRVVKLCEKYDFEPIMWSDMFFRLGSKFNDYYDKEADIPERVIKMIPNVRLCYWDYYHQDEDMYEHMLTQHEKMGTDTVFAGGIWTWAGFLPQVKRTDATMRPALKACARHRVKTVFATLWEDDGAETNHLLSLNQWPLFSEFCWQGPEVSDAEIQRMGEMLTGVPTSVYQALGEFFPGPDDRRTGKGLIWCDILYPMMEYDSDTVEEAQKRAESALIALQPVKGVLEFDYAALLFEIVKRKAALIAQLRARYLADDKAFIRNTAQKTIPELLSLYERLTSVHRTLWERDYKRNGWEVLCLRYGAVTGRLKDVADELLRYADGMLPNVAELDETPLKSARKGGMQFYQVYVSPSFTL